LTQYQVVDVHGGNHSVFLQHPREVPEAMRTFLATEFVSPRPDDR
jgi:hypothetical protein